MGFSDRREAPCRLIVYLKSETKFYIDHLELIDFAKEFGNFSRKDVCIYTLLKYQTEVVVQMHDS